MSDGLDHVIIFVRDLETGASDFERAGFTVTPGGQHANGVTHNALITFADGTYLELIALVDPAAPPTDTWTARFQRGEGLVGYALRGHDLARAAEAVRQRGLAVSAPADNGRVRPDGQQIAWRTFSADEPSLAGALPFVIEDLTPRELRVPGGAAARHQLQVSRLAGVTVRVHDLDHAARAYAALLGVEAKPSPPSVAGADRACRFSFGGYWVELVAAPSSEGAPAGGELYEIVLAGVNPAGPGQGELRPAALTHGARVRVA